MLTNMFDNEMLLIIQRRRFFKIRELRSKTMGLCNAGGTNNTLVQPKTKTLEPKIKSFLRSVP